MYALRLRLERNAGVVDDGDSSGVAFAWSSPV
jgi:hypothetical protein